MTQLTEETFEKTLQSFVRSDSIDLRSVTFSDPYGMVGLLEIVFATGLEALVFGRGLGVGEVLGVGLVMAGPALVAREFICEIRGRVDHRGTEIVPLDLERVRGEHLERQLVGRPDVVRLAGERGPRWPRLPRRTRRGRGPGGGWCGRRWRGASPRSRSRRRQNRSS